MIWTHQGLIDAVWQLKLEAGQPARRQQIEEQLQSMHPEGLRLVKRSRRLAEVRFRLALREAHRKCQVPIQPLTSIL